MNFADMTTTELRTYLDGYHARRDFDFWFEAAAREFRRRVDGIIADQDARAALRFEDM